MSRPQVEKGEAQESLFGCFSDIPICLWGTFFPCYPSATAKSNLDNRKTTPCDCFVCIPDPYQIRQSIRSKYHFGYTASSPCSDCLTACFCTQCMICQNRREINTQNKLLLAKNQKAIDTTTEAARGNIPAP